MILEAGLDKTDNSMMFGGLLMGGLLLSGLGLALATDGSPLKTPASPAPAPPAASPVNEGMDQAGDCNGIPANDEHLAAGPAVQVRGP